VIGYNLYLVPRERDDQTGEEWDGEPVFLHLSYGSHREALATQRLLEVVYAPSRIEIDVRCGINTTMPGESP
jgi:hypothetical protein